MSAPNLGAVHLTAAKMFRIKQKPLHQGLTKDIRINPVRKPECLHIISWQSVKDLLRFDLFFFVWHFHLKSSAVGDGGGEPPAPHAGMLEATSAVERQP